jgi:hypothetical protein
MHIGPEKGAAKAGNAGRSVDAKGRRGYSSHRCGSLNTTLKTVPPPLRGS